MALPLHNQTPRLLRLARVPQPRRGVDVILRQVRLLAVRGRRRGRRLGRRGRDADGRRVGSVPGVRGELVRDGVAAGQLGADFALALVPALYERLILEGQAGARAVRATVAPDEGRAGGVGAAGARLGRCGGRGGGGGCWGQGRERGAGGAAVQDLRAVAEELRESAAVLVGGGGARCRCCVDGGHGDGAGRA